MEQKDISIDQKTLFRKTWFEYEIYFVKLKNSSSLLTNSMKNLDCSLKQTDCNLNLQRMPLFNS